MDEIRPGGGEFVVHRPSRRQDTCSARRGEVTSEQAEAVRHGVGVEGLQKVMMLEKKTML